MLKITKKDDGKIIIDGQDKAVIGANREGVALNVEGIDEKDITLHGCFLLTHEQFEDWIRFASHPANRELYCEIPLSRLKIMYLAMQDAWKATNSNVLLDSIRYIEERYKLTPPDGCL